MDTLLANLTETGLMLVGFALHAVLSAREIDRTTPEREPFAGILAASLWGADSRWGTITVVVMIGLLGLTGTATTALATLGISVAETGGKVLLFAGAGYAMESLAPKLLASVGRKAEAL